MSRRSATGTGVALAIALAAALLGPARAEGVVLPPGFNDEFLANIANPTSIDFLPDGRGLVTLQAGQVRIIEEGNVLPQPALDLSARVCDNIERGLVGVAVSPNFPADRYVYLFYTYKLYGVCPAYPEVSILTPVNRVSRFVFDEESDVLDPTSEEVLIDNIASPMGFHNAGDLFFGKDGNLYVSTGDAALWRSARQHHTLHGKILRITPDGGIPTDNPFVGPDSDRCNVTGGTVAGSVCQEIFAWGLRNPYRTAADPNSTVTRFFINDVGQNDWEEVNIGVRGADYGWDEREGPCPYPLSEGSTCGPAPVPMTDPIWTYHHDTDCDAVTGGAFVPEGIWPEPYDGAYLFADFVCGRIWRLVENGDGSYDAVDFATNLGGWTAVDLVFGPYRDGVGLYYPSRYGDGQLRVISFVGGNRPPTAVLEADANSGPSPLEVTFDASGSSDLDGDSLTYAWDFGDGMTTETETPTATHTYTGAENFTAVLVTRDEEGAASRPDRLVVYSGNRPPVPEIDVPTAGVTFSVGERITLSGHANDPDEGALAGTSLTWIVRRRHKEHAHPYVPATAGGETVIVGPAPEDPQAATTSHLEIELRATDSRGQTTVVRQDLRPKLGTLKFTTRPAGLPVEVHGVRYTTPHALASWAGWAIPVSAPDQAGSAGERWLFSSWSHGGTQTQELITPAGSASFRAEYVTVPRALTLPVVSGRAVAGSRVRSSSVVWSGFPEEQELQWQRCDRRGRRCAAIIGARSVTYRLGKRDIGSTVRVVAVSSTRAGSTKAASPPTPVVGRVIHGGPGGTRLLGTAGSDLIRAGQGRDWVRARGGDDLILARDGERDRIDCGRGHDRVRGDAIDAVARNCEAIAGQRASRPQSLR